MKARDALVELLACKSRADLSGAPSATIPAAAWQQAHYAVAETPVIQCCANCHFAGPKHNFSNYSCRRHAPSAYEVPHSQDIRQFVPIFPVMRADDWCGDWENSAP